MPFLEGKAGSILTLSPPKKTKAKNKQTKNQQKKQTKETNE